MSGGGSKRHQDVIATKAAGGELTKEELRGLVAAIADGTLDDVQLGAFLMAVFIQGMTTRETVDLTVAMTQSGDVMTWPEGWVVGDKHSTGGVGDKVSLPLTPALAACGLKVPMISGRGLGHTGGTLDKLESINGMNACLTVQELQEALRAVGCVITGQTRSVVPADKRMYAARDITNTVSSTPLIVYMNYPIGTDVWSMLDMNYPIGTDVWSMLDMNYPIGRAIGNALEVAEAVECLNGRGPDDLRQLVVALGGELLRSAGLCSSASEGKEKIAKTLSDGSALGKFRDMLQIQGVSAETASAVCSGDPAALPAAPYTTHVLAEASGVVTGQDALAVAEVSVALGAGRTSAGDAIRYDVGITLDKVVGETVKPGDVWATVHHGEPAVPPHLLQKLREALTVDTSSSTAFTPPPRVVNVI
ncbi:thymidine phosphorylase [Hyalella azteca]|uniref:Thymidine phosphorylase n=1 Tax=Hyalella azteca TaxID=294128 RepID=A0A8B7NP44_HYAAZ|nr:thymidine phosphorylase [Hyalella azteca]